MKLASIATALAAVTGVTLSIIPSASAFTISGNTITGLTSADVNKSFVVDFNGSVESKPVAGLTSEATFTFKGFQTSGSNTNAIFDIILKNTSSGGISSRVSVLGFNTTGTERTSSSVTGVFTNDVINGRLPNGFDDIDICFTGGPNCNGGADGGVNNNASLPGTFGQGSLTATVALTGAINSLNLNKFGVRYQSITGTAFGSSGTGTGTIRIPSVPPVKSVPEPASLLGLGLVASGMVMARRRRNFANN